MRSPRERGGPSCCARAEQGILLIEAMVYLAIFAVVVGVAVTTFFKFWSATQHLEKNAEDIARAIEAGEQWREDVRSATGPLHRVDSEGQQALEIPRGTNLVVYWASSEGVWRRASEGASWSLLLPRTHHSRMIRDPRKHVVAWRWELELKSSSKSARVAPRFTFLAVPPMDGSIAPESKSGSESESKSGSELKSESSAATPAGEAVAPSQPE